MAQIPTAQHGAVISGHETTAAGAAPQKRPQDVPLAPTVPAVHRSVAAPIGQVRSFNVVPDRALTTG